MSQNEYRMKIVLDDSQIKDIEKRFMNMFGMKGSGATKTGGTESSNPIKNLMKLGGIAAGIGLLVTSVKKILDLTIDASPMLKGMLQLFNNSVMFILRPIGDFIGYLLKPIMIYLLRYVAIPFYKNFDPWMRKYGTKIGDALVGVLAFFATGKTPSSTTSQVILALNPATASAMVANWLKDALGQYFDPNNNNFIFKGIAFSAIQTVWNNLTAFFTGIGGGIKSIQTSWDQLWAWFTGIGNGLKPLVTAWDQLWSFFSGIGNGIKPLMSAWDKLYAWFSSMGSTINSIFVKAWDALVAFFKAIQDFFKDPLGNIMKFLTGQQTNTQTTKTSPSSLTAPNIVINIDKAMGDVSKWGSDLEQTILSTLQKWYNRGSNP